MYLAKNLKFLREQRGKTQQELANLFGVEQKTLSSWECGSRTPVIGMIVEMAKYYEVSLDDLVLADMRPPIPVYARNLAYLRKKYGMTQQELVEIIGLKHKSSISLIEAGKYEPSILAFYVIRLNFNGFFKRLAGPSGKAGEAIAKKMRKIL